ncbi:MAG: AAA family ATPase [Elusimicrobiota bacterium]
MSSENIILQKVEKAQAVIKEQIAQVIVGQNEVVEELLISIFAEGHCLIVGVPGLAKTLLVSTLAKTLNLHFNRIQFTPDLMPSDITGTEVIQEDKVSRERVFKFIQGPVFSNVILADEINRTPPKTQAALLQAMQEKKVTVAGQTYSLPNPFFVLATQNPIEQEGTYPLPEAQLDRFLFQINIGYPTFEEEKLIVSRTTQGTIPEPKIVFDAAELKEIQNLVKQVVVADSVTDFAVRLCRATRPQDPSCPAEFRKKFSWGAGPRASQSLMLSAKARALLKGYTTVSVEDIKAMAYPVLRHRIVLSFQAEAEGLTTDLLIKDLIEFLSK